MLILARYWPKKLSQLLEILSHGQEAPIKVCYGSQGDVNYLALGWSGHLGYDALCHWSPVIDLEVACKSLGLIHAQHGGLSTLCQKLLGFEIPKDMRLSNWGARPMTHQQVRAHIRRTKCIFPNYIVASNMGLTIYFFRWSMLHLMQEFWWHFLVVYRICLGLTGTSLF